MYAYIGWGVVAFVLWCMVVSKCQTEARDNPTKENIRRAQWAWLSVFLLPVYPAVVFIVVLSIPIWNYLRLSKWGKENKEETE